MCDHLIRQIEKLPVLGRVDAERIVDQFFNATLIPILQRDPAITSRSFYEWRISLADARAAITEHLHHRIRGHIHCDDVVYLLDAFAGRYHADHE